MRSMPTPRYTIRRFTGSGAEDVGELYELTSHGQVALHTEDGALVDLLAARGILQPVRPPRLDAGQGGVHGRYRVRPQVNFFFAPPIEDVAEAIRSAGAEDGFTVTEAAPAAR
ncbi:MAG TPA: hypothetical protein VJP59_01515 [Gemmatimonadota bacterium]|nr:hypothetical protein [Gemmatimonadota bacterium]